MNQLVLSLFPGIGLLDMAFEQEGFCVVRGPDLLWGGDIRSFHPPAGAFQGVIGGPPCQLFSRLRHLNPRSGQRHGNLIPQFERVVSEALPHWFLMENVEGAPIPASIGYAVHDQLVRDVWVGGETLRLRRFSWGVNEHCSTHGGGCARGRLDVDTLALHRADAEPSALASASVRIPVRIGGSGKPKRTLPKNYCDKDAKGVVAAIRSQGLSADFLSDAPFTVAGKLKVIGQGVPLPMGRAIAKAVKRALNLEAA